MVVVVVVVVVGWCVGGEKRERGRTRVSDEGEENEHNLGILVQTFRCI